MVLDAKVVAFAGGVGGAKLVYGLSKSLSPEHFTIIGNVADDLDLFGLHISPDLDTVMYTLAGLANPAAGWGITDETWQTVEMLRHYGEEVWFNLGDRDFATHILRTQWLKQGHSLTTVTARLLERLGVHCTLLPVTDDPLRTMVDTQEYGTLPFQEYFVRYQWQPTALNVWFYGMVEAQATTKVVTAIREADVIVFCPSNPVLSIAPLLAVPGVREALVERHGVCVAVSPFVGGKALKGPAEKLMRELKLDISATGLIDYYEGLLDGLVIDKLDQEQAVGSKIPILVTETVMKSEDDKVRLAEEVLRWVGSRKS
ncbi:MAG TPA: 2-phospho-L-lactate transferase [Aggregatilineaceae bacterium]|nr:2-phospho-L-lactate transferase [Aggregatilineaceae bacterium]